MRNHDDLVLRSEIAAPSRHEAAWGDEIAATPPQALPTGYSMNILPESLGSAAFRRDYRLRYAYLAGAMYRGIASKELVVALGRAGLMGYLGTGGMGLTETEESISFIQSSLNSGQSYGVNLLHHLGRPDLEMQMAELFIKHDVRFVDAAAFMTVTPALALCRSRGLKLTGDGTIERPRRIMGKISRPEIAAAFLRPAPDHLLDHLVSSGRISRDEAALSRRIPLVDDLCVEADSGGHTDKGVALALLPAMTRLRDEMTAQWKYESPIHVGAAGGIGTPHAAAAAFVLGADFVVTGSINQCTVEAGTSDSVKNLLELQGIHDTTYAPAGDMFEMGAKVQVAKRGMLFPARANKLYDVYRHNSSLEDIDPRTRRKIEEDILHRSFDGIWTEIRERYARNAPEKLAEFEGDPKKRMASIFKWYLAHSSKAAMTGMEASKLDYQIHCGPALGAFNDWVKGTPLESWRERKVAIIGRAIMEGAAQVLNERFAAMHSQQVEGAGLAMEDDEWVALLSRC
jgi:trans-AT polyketide synthase/acyltransferase/oxidoreductase domain-containing protein